MQLNFYQRKAMETAAYGNQRTYPFLALSEEVGELNGKLAKMVRKENRNLDEILLDLRAGLYLPRVLEDIQKELGDVLWQVAACATELGISFDDLGKQNLSKLKQRAVKGSIIGEGDDR